MKKLNIFLACLFCTITITAQNLYIYKTDGTVYGKQTSTIDSINFAKAQDSFYVHHLDTIKRYAVSEVDSLSFSAPTNTADAGVVINGVKWATRNVATPGTFATSAEDAGMFYQWNSKVGWPATGDIGCITASDGSTIWNSSWNGGYTKTSSTDTWKSANDPSPSGWRVPTYAEIETLHNTAKVTPELITLNGINGEKFTDKTTGTSIFLSSTGYRYSLNGSLDGDVYYWSNTAYTSSYAYYLGYGLINGTYYADRADGLTIRPVAK